MPRAVATFDRSVDRRLVHRSSIAGVFLTSVRRQTADVWTLGVQVPRPWPVPPRRHPTTVPLTHGVEVLRQCGLAVAHSGLDIPLDHAFTIQQISFGWSGPAPRYPDFGPYEATARMQLVERLVRRGTTTGLRLAFRLTAATHEVAVGGGVLRCLPRHQYDLLRRRAAPGPPVTRHDRAPVRRMVRRGGRVSGLVGWDHTDPFAFDHPTDHLPGMTLLRSAIDAAEAATSARVRALDVSFDRFTEYAPPPTISATPDPSGVVHVEVTQAGSATTRGLLRVG
ncbi:AfsA-related hotdog domain-containing protein [Cellulomonas sp.]|uniref:AfsA-related hotdog domain-containing protein n=1 Tax=Cellulomonas sp. TaxID=40001 RepID=UPI001B2A69E5|nr:AfsA-related hotdog domain-containing protein [Cellulomonas sp.]MBO9556715.1 hypothetical protein [Cellulomonas sp.]